MFREVKKQHIYIMLMVIIISLTGFILIKYIRLSGSSIQVSLSPGVKPAYLQQRLPSIDKLKEVINNPKFKEMQYADAFFAPVVVEKKGRSNPFMPPAKQKK